MSKRNYDDLLISWEAKSNPSYLPFGAEGLLFCAGDSARSLLLLDGWTFHKDTLDCSLVSLNESLANKEDFLNVYPNPTNGVIHINTDKRIERIAVFDLQGRFLSSTSLNVTFIELPESKGMYLIQIRFQDGTIRTEKVIKKS